MAKTKLNTYDVNFRVVAIIGVQVQAESFVDALEKAKALKTTDLITTEGDFNDCSEQIISVGQNSLWNLE